jgi:hypothetical protein
MCLWSVVVSKFEENYKNITCFVHTVITRNLVDILLAYKFSCLLKTFQDNKVHIL